MKKYAFIMVRTQKIQKKKEKRKKITSDVTIFYSFSIFYSFFNYKNKILYNDLFKLPNNTQICYNNN